MTTREEFEAWLTRGKPSAATERKADYEGLCGWNEYRSTHTEAMWSAWQASRSAALEEAAKECDEMQAMWERQARGGDNTGASDFRADAAEQCALGIRALK